VHLSQNHTFFFFAISGQRWGCGKKAKYGKFRSVIIWLIHDGSSCWCQYLKNGRRASKSSVLAFQSCWTTSKKNLFKACMPPPPPPTLCPLANSDIPLASGCLLCSKSTRVGTENAAGFPSPVTMQHSTRAFHSEWQKRAPVGLHAVRLSNLVWVSWWWYWSYRGLQGPASGVVKPSLGHHNGFQ